FFFQAEDGIRDLTVTGVQTCALPIFLLEPTRAPPFDDLTLSRSHGFGDATTLHGVTPLEPCRHRLSRHPEVARQVAGVGEAEFIDRKSTRLNSSHSQISYAVFCLKKK